MKRVRRAWLISYAVSLGGTSALIALATVMGWDYEVVGWPILGCIMLGVAVLELLKERERDLTDPPARPTSSR